MLILVIILMHKRLESKEIRIFVVTVKDVVIIAVIIVMIVVRTVVIASVKTAYVELVEIV